MRVLRQRVATTEAGRRLDEHVGAWLAAALGQPLSKSAVRRLIMAGAVDLGGRPLRRPGQTLRAGDRLEAHIDPERLATAADAPLVLEARHILYEDDALLAVDKPPGLSTVATADPQRPYVVAAVEQYLSARGVASPYVGVHQRLDRDTSGVVLFAKDRSVNPGLARAFAEHEAEKTYHALVARTHRLPPPSWRTAEPIEGQASETLFECREVLARGLLVEARPRTGRKHQIRIHLAHAGWPIVGDSRYGARGGPGLEAPRVMLHACSLRLIHPQTGQLLRIESPYPDDFQSALAALRNQAPVRGGGGVPR